MNTEARIGYIHPLSQVTNTIAAIFVDMGFEVADAQHIEDEWYNFDALNVPLDHPARDMQDTFFIKNDPGKLLRTHTSNVQIRFMENNAPPLKIIAPGLVYRNEATDATHEVQFGQIEGLVVGRKISMGHLKGTLEKFIKTLYGDEVDMRLRPGFFPFVEPGVEVDLSCQICKGDGSACSVCKGVGWREVLGAGMVHPNVLSNVGIDPKEFSGFAFGVGVDRLAMMKWGVPDVRMFYQGDVRLMSALQK